MRFDLFRSGLLRGIGTLAGASLLVLFTAFPAAAGPVRVDFSGTVTGYYNGYGAPGDFGYQSEIEGAVAIGAGFSGGFLYDPAAPGATIISQSSIEAMYSGLTSGVDFQMDRVGGGFFSYDPASAPDAFVNIVNDPTTGDLFIIYLGNLLPTIDTIPGAPAIQIGFRASEMRYDGSQATLVDSVLPPTDLAATILPLGGVVDADRLRFSLFAPLMTYVDENGRPVLLTLNTSVDSITFTPAPEPAPLGLMLLGIAYVIRRRLRG